MSDETRPKATEADALAAVRTLIMTQDRKIAEKAGRDRGPIRTITRSAA